MKYTLLVSAILTLITAAPAWADATVTYSVPEDQVDALPQQAFVQGGKVLVKNAGDANTDLLFDSANATMYIIDHSSSSYTPLNEATLMALQEKVSGMRAMLEQQLQGLPQEQRAQMEQMMQSMGTNMAEPAARPVPTLEEIGDTSYSGFDCSEQRVMEGDLHIATVCLSNGNNVGLGDADYQTLLGMQNFTFSLASKAKDLAAQTGNSIPDFSGASFDRLIIQGSDETGGNSGSMNITGIDDGTLPAGTTAIPDGYTPQDIPNLGSLMQ